MVGNFHKNFDFISIKERNYLLSQAINKQKKISLCKENLNMIFNLAYSSLPVQLGHSLGKEIKSVILIANNHEISLQDLKNYINDSDLIVCFNFSIFLKFYKHFPENKKLFFFRKENHLNFHFLGMPQSTMSDRSIIDVNFNDLFDVLESPQTYLLFNEHLPHTMDLPTCIYQKINNPSFTGLVSQFHRIFHYLENQDHYFNSSTTTPTSGFMAFKYFYYTRLYLLDAGKPSFNIKLMGFNFTNDSFYRTYGVHNWEYERSQLENLPDGIERIMVP